MNIIAVGSMMQIMEKTNNFFINFENFINNMLFNFNACLKYDQANEGKKTPKDSRSFGISKRRETIRKTNLFNEIEIKSFFTNLMQVSIIQKKLINLLILGTVV